MSAENDVAVLAAWTDDADASATPTSRCRRRTQKSARPARATELLPRPARWAAAGERLRRGGGLPPRGGAVDAVTK